MRLVLENKDGKAVRTFNVQTSSAVVISRTDTKRVELHTSTEALDAAKVRYEKIADISMGELEKEPLAINGGKLRVVGSINEIARNTKPVVETDDQWRKSLKIVSIAEAAIIVLLIALTFVKMEEPEVEKQEIVQIVKRIEMPKPVPQPKQVVEHKPTPRKVVARVRQSVVHKTKVANVKRMGALSVFGSLSQSKQRGGVNLGAVNSSAGPGLGGNAGSGGMQTTLYGKGLVAAPIGAGANERGGGGYGTKGRGGGQAGYGKMSLIGSAGTSTIPLGHEAMIEGGLDADSIADVINRNMGQIRYCYEQGLQGKPSLKGRVAISFTIDPRGRVSTAGVRNTTLNSSLVEGCMVARLKTWKFPTPAGGLDVKVSYPFMLQRAGTGIASR
jgi:hypothetical protein